MHHGNSLWMAARVDVEGSSLVLSGGSGTQKKRETLRLVELIGEARGGGGPVAVHHLWQSCMASAAAVPSSSREALATGKPVMSQIMVW